MLLKRSPICKFLYNATPIVHVPCSYSCLYDNFTLSVILIQLILFMICVSAPKKRVLIQGFLQTQDNSFMVALAIAKKALIKMEQRRRKRLRKEHCRNMTVEWKER